MVLLIHIPETHGPSHKGRSGEATEHKHNRLLSLKIGKYNAVLVGHIPQLEIRRRITLFRGDSIIPGLPSLDGLSIVCGSPQEIDGHRDVLVYHTAMAMLVLCYNFTTFSGRYLAPTSNSRSSRTGWKLFEARVQLSLLCTYQRNESLTE